LEVMWSSELLDRVTEEEVAVEAVDVGIPAR
jgi:hypothetical protein